MTDDDRRELLAQAMWTAHLGETSLRAEFIEWAKAHPEEANALRTKADEMIATVRGAKTQAAAAGGRATPHHSLGWLGL